MKSATQPVLIDTDIGDDVDDAFALALAAVLPHLRVCAVTTVSGPVEERARLAEHILRAAGQAHVPVVPGSSAMRNGRPGPNKFSHTAVLDRNTVCEHPATETATQCILRNSRQYLPLTLIALGPLTNIAAALDEDPSLARRARLVAMAGTLGVPYPDWNLRCDPAAARKVLASGMAITVVGMHVTMQTKMRASQVAQMFCNPRPLVQVLARCVLAWRTRQRRLPILHDALTVAVAADRNIARQEPRHMRVGGGGFSRATRSAQPNVQVCTTVDLPRFTALLDTHLFGAPQPLVVPCDVWCLLLRYLA